MFALETLAKSMGAEFDRTDPVLGKSISKICIPRRISFANVMETYIYNFFRNPANR